MINNAIVSGGLQTDSVINRHVCVLAKSFSSDSL